MIPPKEPSSENLENLMALLGKIGTDLDTQRRSVHSLCREHKELMEQLIPFEPTSVIRLISALETVPELHENTIRIEVLLHIAVSSCRGTKLAEPNEVRRWATMLDASVWTSQEDPAEDVFVGYVCTSGGGFRTYQGIFSNADFILERLLYFLADKVDYPGIKEAYDSVIELLRISESVVDYLEQSRYIVGGHSAQDSIQIPQDGLLEKYSGAISFSADRIMELGIDFSKLNKFLFKKDQVSGFDDKPFFGSPLERCPLYSTTDGFIIASPSNLCRAAVASILEVTPSLGDIGDIFFGKENAEFFVNDVLPRLGIQSNSAISLPEHPESLPNMFPFVGQFDLGMPVLALIKNSTLTKGSDLEAVEGMSDKQAKDLAQYIHDCCAACECIEGFRGGLILIAVSGVGRPIVFANPDLNANWYLYSCCMADWHTLTFDTEFSAKRLWYLSLQKDVVKKANVNLVNVGGLLNLYAFWKSQNFQLLPKEINPNNPHNMLSIDGSYSCDLNASLKHSSDRHCLQAPSESNWTVLHRTSSGQRSDLSKKIKYGDILAAKVGQLRGCIEYKDFCWWIEADGRPENSEAQDLCYRLWDCVSDWAEHIVPSLHEQNVKWVPRRLNIVLTFPNIDDWKTDEVSCSSDKSAEIVISTDQAENTAQLIIPESFLSNFHRPDNLAEREIVGAILRGAAGVHQARLSEDEEHKFVRFITKNSNTRFFHIILSSNLELALGGSMDAEPVFIPPEEMARAQIGLAHLVNDNASRKITDVKAAQRFLDSIVAKLQADLSAFLNSRDLISTVAYSFSQLDEHSRDGSRWRLSTRALLALEDSSDSVQERIRGENGRRAMAEITNRALIETSAYSYNPDANERISQTEHATLLAKIAVMIEFANHRDAIVNRLVPADLEIHPNGSISYDDAFQRQTFEPYMRSRIDDRIQSDADSYEKYFREYQESISASDLYASRISALEKVFMQEFQVSLAELFRLLEFFDKQAVEIGYATSCLKGDLFRNILRHEIKLSEHQIEVFLDRFVLPIRQRWDRSLPSGCDHNDVFPWRYFRGLSILTRPIIEISQQPQAFLVSASHLHRSLQYLVNSISEGNLPSKLFQSDGMKSYLGNIADQSGHDFTVKVAAKLKNLVPNQRVEIKLTELGAPKVPDLGDIDVLGWNKEKGIVFLIECKNLKPALTVRQVIQQLEEFRGDMEKLDYLAKFKRRIEWIKKNTQRVLQLTGIIESRLIWVPFLVTSDRVPMAFVDAIDYPKSQVVAFQDLEKSITRILRNNMEGS